MKAEVATIGNTLDRSVEIKNQNEIRYERLKSHKEGISGPKFIQYDSNEVCDLYNFA